MNEALHLEQCCIAFQHYRSRQFNEALSSLRPSLRPDSGLPSLVRAVANNLAASCFLQLGRRAQAEHHWRLAIDIQADYADAWLNLSVFLRKSKRYADAQRVCDQAIQLNPGSSGAYNSLGNIMLDRSRYEEAESAYRQAAQLAPGNVEVHYNLGNALYQLKHYAEAAQAYRRALAIDDGHVGTILILGVTLHALDCNVEAEALLRRAVGRTPENADAHHGLANLLRTLGRLDEAEQCYRKAVELRPECNKARINLAFFLLCEGRYTEGWSLYESRYDVPGFIFRATKATLRCLPWRGESLEGKSLLIFQEDGLGDTLQFGRYLSELKALGTAHIAVACDAALHRLFASHDAVDAVLSSEAGIERAGGFDWWTSVMSVPHYLHTTIDTVPRAAYLRADPARVEAWRRRLDALPAGPRIGLVWKGNPLHDNDAHRSMPSLASLAPMWSLQGVSFVSLQKGQGEDEARNSPPGQPLLHLGSEVTDMAETAAIIEQLDLVICVDTSTAHLAGSLGKPCWVMLSARGTDWRWMRERSDSPWYPHTLRVFRQPSPGDWDAVVRQVCWAYTETFAERVEIAEAAAG